MAKNFRQRVQQAKSIAEALTSNEDHSGESWYQDRKKACDSCEHNSENANPSGFIHQVHEKKCVAATSGNSKRYCTACTCCIDLKIGVKREVCGAVEIGEEPKWLAQETESFGKGIPTTIESHGDTKYKVSYENSEFILDFGEVKEDLLNFSFITFVPKQFTFVDVRTTCGCTVAESKEIDEARRVFSIKLSTSGFGKERPTTRTVVLMYRGGEVMVKFRVQKI